MSPSGTLFAAQMARMPCITPSEGSFGVVETLWIANAAVTVSDSTMSVKFPPTSIPIVFMASELHVAKRVWRTCTNRAMPPGRWGDGRRLLHILKKTRRSHLAAFQDDVEPVQADVVA